MSTLADARAAALRAHPASPFITDRTQGRVELSHATFDNWVTKTVNFLHMEADIAGGSRVGLHLPLHWMAAVWLVSVWESGADVVLHGEPADLTVSTDAGDVLVVPDALGMAPPPPGASAQWSFPADVRAMPDQRLLPADSPGGLPGMSAQDVFEAAAGYAERVGLRTGGRLATQLPVDTVPGVLAAIGAPLAVGASVIYGAAEQEFPTATADGRVRPA